MIQNSGPQPSLHRRIIWELSKFLMLGPGPRPIKSDALGWRKGISRLSSFPGDSKVQLKFRTIDGCASAGMCYTISNRMGRVCITLPM